MSWISLKQLLHLLHRGNIESFQETQWILSITIIISIKTQKITAIIAIRLQQLKNLFGYNNHSSLRLHRLHKVIYLDKWHIHYHWIKYPVFMEEKGKSTWICGSLATSGIQLLTRNQITGVKICWIAVRILKKVFKRMIRLMKHQMLYKILKLSRLERRWLR